MAENGQEDTNGHSKDEEKDKALANSQITNSNDRKLKEARIFVGNLPADLRTEKGEVYDKFRKHGPIMGVSVHGRFAFVQYHSETDAKAACKAETGSEFRSARLEVKMALEGKARGDSRERDGNRRRSRSPIDRRRESRDRGRDRSRERNGRRSRDRRDSRAQSPPSTYIPSPVEDRFCHPRTYGANDVEMVVIRKSQGEYADSILRRLYDRRISANMLFLAEHASLDGAVNEFGRCGTRYVITVMPKHEETRAITINIFEGDQAPREVRNINVDEGVNLIYRHFREHFPALARLREMELQGPGFYPVPPSEVQRTMTRMLETSAVPTSSLDAAIRYLQDMRDRTAIAEGMMPQAPPAAPLAYRPEPDLAKALFSNEDSLRDSVLGLLKATGIVGGVPGGGAASAQQPGGYVGGGDYASQYAGYAGANANINTLSANPAVAKALENLVTTGLLNRQNPSAVVSNPQTSLSQGNRQNSPAVHAANIPSYRTSHSDLKPEVENGGGGGTLYVGQGGQEQRTVGYPQQQQQQGSQNQQQGTGSGGYASMGYSGSGASGGYSQSAGGQQQAAPGGYGRSGGQPQQQQSGYQTTGSQGQQNYASYNMQRQQMPAVTQPTYSTQRR